MNLLLLDVPIDPFRLQNYENYKKNCDVHELVHKCKNTEALYRTCVIIFTFKKKFKKIIYIYIYCLVKECYQSFSPF